jgi:uncharacterized protein (DUF2141 family)
LKISRRLFAKLASSAVLLALLPSSLPAQTGTSCVIVRVTDVRNAAGKVVIGIWNSKNGFPKESSKAFRQATEAIVNGTATATFADVPYGEYAVGVYHDENNNGKMDTRFPGIPVEGVGSSNNVHPRFSAPSFRDCRFDVRDPEKIVSIKIMYL